MPSTSSVVGGEGVDSTANALGACNVLLLGDNPFRDGGDKAAVVTHAACFLVFNHN